MTPVIDEPYKLITVAAIVDTTRFRGIWRGQSYEARALPDTSDLTVGDAVVCCVLPGTSELVAVRRLALGVDCIILWSGSVATIPTGWHLCDGTGGTPDLRDYFIRVSWDNADIGYTAGADSYSLSHQHNPGLASADDAGTHKHRGVGPALTDTGERGGFPPGDDYNHGSPHGHAAANYETSAGTPHHHSFNGYTALDSQNVDVRPPYYALCYIAGKASNVPIGGIVLFAGTYLAIPVNFAICDGTGGTPATWWHLIVGAGGAKAVNTSGGLTALQNSDLAHTHGLGTIAMADNAAHAHGAWWEVNPAGACEWGTIGPGPSFPGQHVHEFSVFEETGAAGADSDSHGHVPSANAATGGVRNPASYLYPEPSNYVLVMIQRVS
ncbi:MAG: hypothetical protein WC718_15495 [Phycisphaerales bacterium]|jgi:hypothetical protein